MRLLQRLASPSYRTTSAADRKSASYICQDCLSGLVRTSGDHASLPQTDFHRPHQGPEFRSERRSGSDLGTLDLKSIAEAGEVARSGGDDLFFTLADGETVLSHEMNVCAPESGSPKAWVRIPELSCGEDTELFVYYGDLEGQTGRQVWDSNYKLVHHLNGADPKTELPHSDGLNISDRITVQAWASTRAASTGDSLTAGSSTSYPGRGRTQRETSSTTATGSDTTRGKLSTTRKAGMDMTPVIPTILHRGIQRRRLRWTLFLLCPLYDGDGDQFHGKILRYDTLGTNGAFSLRYCDYGHNGGLCAAVPGPSFLVNTETASSARPPIEHWRLVGTIWSASTTPEP